MRHEACPCKRCLHRCIEVPTYCTSQTQVLDFANMNLPASPNNCVLRPRGTFVAEIGSTFEGPDLEEHCGKAHKDT